MSEQNTPFATLTLAREKWQMKRGQLGPEAMRLYIEPVLAELSYTKMHKDPFPTPQEAQVWFLLNDETKTAFVPLNIVNEERNTVTAALIGEFQGRIVVSFPPTNFGQTRFSVEAADLEKIVLEA